MSPSSKEPVRNADAGVRRQVVRQRNDLPGIYGGVDFTIVPERFDSDAAIDDERFAATRTLSRRVFDQPALMEIDPQLHDDR